MIMQTQNDFTAQGRGLTFAEYIPSDTFDEDLFEQIVESITVISGQKLSFRLAGGLVLTEKI